MVVPVVAEDPPLPPANDKVSGRRLEKEGQEQA